MKSAAAAAAAVLVGLGAETSASFLPSFSKFRTTEDNANHVAFLLDEAELSTLVDDPPSFVSSADASYGFAADVVSLGSVTRMDYLTSQIETWASHRAIRHFWGFSELQDYDPECSSMSDEARAAVVDTCKASMAFKDPKIQSFFSEYYGLSEGHRMRSDEAGWICAQRRAGRAFGWLHSQYGRGKATVPDYLIMVDDDTYVDLVDVMAYLEKEDKKTKGRAFARAGCVFPQNEVIPFPLSYGGFGTVLNKAAIQKLSEPIHCAEDVSEYRVTCSQIKADTVGEAAVFQEGMTVFELFFKYSALKDFCLHSDWLLGYVLEYYLPHSLSNSEQAEGDHTLMGMMNYPSCGNITVATGSVRRCTQYSDTCHNQAPKDMEAMAISSYAQSPESYSAIPKMELTAVDVALNMVKSHKYVPVESAPLPNVFVLGAIDAGSSEIAEFLFSNGVCGPKILDSQLDNMVHFFDREDLYNRGFGFYSKYFEHCSDCPLVMDNSPDTLKHAERVYDMYHQVNPSSPSNLKVIAVISESNPDEYGNLLETWTSMFDRQQLLVLSSSELQHFPQRSQWRIEQFLGHTFDGTLERVDVGGSAPVVSTAPRKDMGDEFYQFMDESKGPWMEQHPFPRAVTRKTFAYASVLGWNPDRSQNELYLAATRVLIQALKDSSADFVVLMMYEDEVAEEALCAAGVIVKHISPVKHSLHNSYFEPWFVDIALAKLRAFELTDYDRVQVVDVDSAVLDPEQMEKLFASFPNTKLVAEGLGPDSPLRAGWLLIRPSLSDFNAMQQLLERGVFTTQHGWDNLDLPVDYPDWRPANPLINWEFYGSQLEQGLLFHHFYALPKSVNPSLEDGELLVLLDDETLQSLGFLHFYGELKPWGQVHNVSSLPKHVASARSQWLKEFELLMTVANPSHKSPLTPVGFKQYRRAQALYTSTPTSTPSASPVSPSPVSSAPVSSAPVTLTPSQSPVTFSPTSSPTVPLTTIQMQSILEWNITCAGQDSTSLVNIAKILEEAIYNGMIAQLSPQQIDVLFVYVYRLCNINVDNHTAFNGATTRLLQVDTLSEIEFISLISQTCSNCAENVFNTSNLALETIVNNGNLTVEIQTIANGTIDGAINPNSTNSTFLEITGSPSASPSSSPVSGSPVSSAPVSGSPVSSAPVSGSPVSSAPVSGSPVSSAPVSGSPVSSAPVSGSPVSGSPVSSAPVSGSPVSSAPVSGSPVSSAPVSGSPVSSAPVSGSPVSSAPVSGSPVSSAPVSGSPVSGAPVSGSPVSGAPVSGAPVSGAPVSSAPVTSTPVTSTPVTSTPVTSTPVTSTPVTSTPVTSTPVTSTPVSSAPISQAPVVIVPPPPPTAIPTRPPTAKPTPFPSQSKSGKQSKTSPVPVTSAPSPQSKSGKQSKTSPVPVTSTPSTTRPTPVPNTSRPTDAKSNKSSRKR